MTSEIENILSGQVVRKVNADKAIGVSTANLMPDEKGEVPLSKQSAFDAVSSITETPNLESMGTQDSLALNSSVGPILEGTGDQATASQQQFSPSSSNVPTDSAESTITQPSSPISVTPVAPAAPVVNETISETPVNVTEPSELGGIDFKSMIPDIPFAEETSQTPVETEVKPVELPKMPETILAEEPTSVDEGLFVDTTVAPQTAPAVSEENHGSSLPNLPEDNLANDLSSLPNLPEENLANDLSSLPNLPEDNLANDLSSLPNLPEEGSNPNQQDESKSIFSPEGLVEEDISEGKKKAESGLDMAKPEERIQLLDQKFLDAIKEIESDENKKLDSINATLSEVVKSLNEIRTLFDEKKGVIAETTTLEQPAVSSPISALPQNSSTAAQVESTTSPVESAPSPVVTPEPVTTSKETIMVPTMDIPLLDESSLDLSNGTVQAPDLEKGSDMVSALDQIGAVDIPKLDETPIKGGMFI